MRTAVLNARHDPGSDSLCSRSFLSDQYPKVSIGIMVDRTPNLESQPRKEDEAVLPTGGKAPQSQGKTLECNHGLMKKAGMSENQTEPEYRKDAVWVPTKPIYHAKHAPETVGNFVHQNSLFRSDEGVHKKSVDMQNVVVAHASARESHMLDKGRAGENTENVVKTNNDSLRLKLWEILGSAPSQNKQVSSSQVLKKDTAIPPIEKMCEHQNSKTTRTKQNSDTIETDSESPNKNMQRPVTRSLTRKQDMKRSLPNLKLRNNSSRKQLSSSVPGSKEKVAEKNVFSFDEKVGKVGSSNWLANNMSSRVTRIRINRNTCKVEPRRISFPRRSLSEKTSESSEKEQPPSVTGVTRRGNIVGATYSSPSKVKMQMLHQSNPIPEKLSQNSETGQKLNLNSPPLEKYVDTHENDSPSRTYTGSPKSVSTQPLSADKNMHENIDSPPSSRNTQPINSFQSPTLAVNITSASLKEMASEQVHCSNTLKQKISNARKPSDFVSSLSSRFGSDSDAYVGTSNYMSYSTESPFEEIQHLKKNKSAEMHLTQSQRRKSDSDSSEADEVTNQGSGAEKWSPDADTNKTSPISFHRCKRLNSLGTEERKRFVEIPKQLQEDGLPRAISQLALVLERFKAKIKSHTSKKNSDILSSVGDRIRLQLQDVESQIQADVGKFTSLAKLKRKRLESTFQDQQEKLNIIHEKFKEEVNQHLLDCRGTLEELESFQMEIKTNVELQRASHRKLLMQVEEAMEVQLTDAETSIATMHRVVREKMDGLKHALREWLSEGIS